MTAEAAGWAWVRAPWDPYWHSHDDTPVLKGGPGHIVVWVDEGQNDFGWWVSRQVDIAAIATIAAAAALALERARIAYGVGFQRLRQSMSLAQINRAMARASWASRCWGRRSVLRRSHPKFDSQELVRSTGHRIPSGAVVLAPAAPGGRRRAQRTSSMPASAAQARTGPAS